MNNTSATGSYLSPINTDQADYDKQLTDVLQEAISGITGIEGSLVRRKYQPVTPKMPEPHTNWVAFYVHSIEPDDSPSITHEDSVSGGYDENVRHERLSVLCTFYGENGEQKASLLRDGLGIPQNMTELRKKGFGLVGVGQVISVPEFINQVWVRRFDVLIALNRKTKRTYSVLNVLGTNENEIVTD